MSQPISVQDIWASSNGKSLPSIVGADFYLLIIQCFMVSCNVACTEASERHGKTRTG